MLCWQGNGLAVSAGAIRMPRVLAARAELPLARRALHQHRLARLAGSHGADGLTVCGGTPRPAGVQVNLYGAKRGNVTAHVPGVQAQAPFPSFILLRG